MNCLTFGSKNQPKNNIERGNVFENMARTLKRREKRDQEFLRGALNSSCFGYLYTRNLKKATGKCQQKPPCRELWEEPLKHAQSFPTYIERCA
jgi:hypothetical protein